ncbi:MAG TPA: STAS domain-containing protein [Terriglobales bacterium]|jgi:anti-anti-sigma factor|nr:STAS domain-containing protein [Terriglobales bacterium]
METSRPVIVKRMPDRLNQKQARMFLHDIQPLLNTDRPQLVFDCSLIRQMDAAGVDMLLHCMAEVMKRDGELKLAAVSPQAAVVLELTRTDRLFEVFETSGDAVKSFYRFLPNAMKNQPVPFPMGTPLPGDGTSTDGASLAA